MWMLNIIDLLTDAEIYEQQRLMLSLKSTLVVKVQTRSREMAWEVATEFTVSDLSDLVTSITNEKGSLFCNGTELDNRLMLGYVRSYIWRNIDIFTIELVS